MKELIVPSISVDEIGFESLYRLLGEQGVQAKIELVNWVEYPYRPEVSLYIAHDQRYIWLRFDVREKQIRAVATKNHEAVCRDSCVEFFVMRPDGSHYLNFETNCIGTSLAARRTGRADASYLTDEQMSRIIRFSSLPQQPLDDRTGGAWSLVEGIPFDLIECNRVPESLMANFYKCGDQTLEPHYLSWNAIDCPSPDFHRPEFFGRLIFI